MSDPRKRPMEPADPLQLRGGSAPGDPEVMMTCVIEEYARMGWDADRIMMLFDRPFFAATHKLAKEHGLDWVRERIDTVLGRCGVMQVSESLEEE